jgi:hypothetical protein
VVKKPTLCKSKPLYTSVNSIFPTINTRQRQDDLLMQLSLKSVNWKYISPGKSALRLESHDQVGLRMTGAIGVSEY